MIIDKYIPCLTTYCLADILDTVGHKDYAPSHPFMLIM